jgi:hypothetical protein
MSEIPLDLILNKNILNIPALLLKAGVSIPREVSFQQTVNIPKVYEMSENEFNFATSGELLYSTIMRK